MNGRLFIYTFVGIQEDLKERFEVTYYLSKMIGLFSKFFNPLMLYLQMLLAKTHSRRTETSTAFRSLYLCASTHLMLTMTPPLPFSFPLCLLFALSTFPFTYPPPPLLLL